jgi:Aspartyl protease
MHFSRILLIGVTCTLFHMGLIGQQKIDAFCDTIPFELVKNKIIVPVFINGQSKRFLFDTGANTCLDSSLQATNRFPLLGKINMQDIAGLTYNADLIKIDSLSLGMAQFDGLHAAVIDLKTKPYMGCFNFDGVIGAEAFSNCAIHIDLQKKYLVITNDIRSLNLQNPYQTPISFNKSATPILTLRLGQVKFKALFDTGMDELFRLGKKTYQKALKKGSLTIINESMGIDGVGAFGYNGAVKMQLAILPLLQMGQYSITGCSTILAEKSDNSNYIGLDLCQYGTVSIDFAHQQFYFVANAPSQAYRQHTTKGFSVEPGPNGGYVAGNVWKGSAAEKAGLKNGNPILKLGNWDLTLRKQSLDCELLLSDMPKEPISVTFKDENGIEKTVLLSM